MTRTEDAFTGRLRRWVEERRRLTGPMWVMVLGLMAKHPPAHDGRSFVSTTYDLVDGRLIVSREIALR